MTISQAISKADGMATNSVSAEKKLSWLSSFDAQVRRETADVREGAPSEPFRPYENVNDELFISDEDGDVYVYMLLSRLYALGTEPDKAKQAREDFRDAYSRWRNAYASSHMHVGTNITF